MNKKYNALIIGCGAQGAGIGQEKNPNKIINFAHALTEHDGFDLIGFMDKDFKKSKKAARTWKCEEYLTLAHDLSQFEIDVFIITTPDETHYLRLKEIAELKPKLVICEKPICTDLEQAREIVELYKAKGIPLMVNYTRRFLPYYDYLKQYGKPINGVCMFNRGLLHTGSHAIDFFNMIDLKSYKLIEEDDGMRIWSLIIEFENNKFWSETRLWNMPVWSYYDKSHMHIIDNAYQFLEGKEEIKCTGEMALKALEKCYELMNG